MCQFWEPSQIAFALLDAWGLVDLRSAVGGELDAQESTGAEGVVGQEPQDRAVGVGDIEAGAIGAPVSGLLT